MIVDYYRIQLNYTLFDSWTDNHDALYGYDGYKQLVLALLLPWDSTRPFRHGLDRLCRRPRLRLRLLC